MASGPYYQSVPTDQTTPDDLRIPQSLLGVDYGPLAPQASMYPDPGHQQIANDYHTQPLVENEAEDHAQLQGLVEAATSAAAQEQIRQQRAQAQQLPAFSSAHQESHGDTAEHDLAALLRDNAHTSKRKRSMSHNSAVDASGNHQTAISERPKRQKRATLHTPDGQEGDQSMRHFNNPIESPHHLDARAAGVHSAAALFRPPSDSSKKYTRPPMSKLFSSLELSPENFLYLQAAAKQYMLDPEHPERQDCVGNRGKGDSDLVKLKLHHCVGEFLEDGGWGEKYFGENAPPPGELDGPMDMHHQRRWIWPRDQVKIISLCTPLLRRMVTNERQRQYAVESRKGGAKPDNKQNGADNGQDRGSNPANQSAEPSLPSNYDPRLPQGPAYQVYMLSRDTQQPIRDRADYSPHEELTWPILTDKLQRVWYETLQVEPPPPDVAPNAFYETFNVKVLTSSGLTAVSNEGEWQLACQDVRQTVWLEGVIKVVVDCAV